MAVALASKGVQVTIADVDVEHGEETVHLVEEEHAKISYKPNSPSALFIRCDVSKTGMFPNNITYEVGGPIVGTSNITILFDH